MHVTWVEGKGRVAADHFRVMVVAKEVINVPSKLLSCHQQRFLDGGNSCPIQVIGRSDAEAGGRMGDKHCAFSERQEGHSVVLHARRQPQA